MTGVFYKGSWLGSSAVGSIASPIVLEQVRSASNTEFVVLIGFRLITLSTSGSPPLIPASRPMVDCSPLPLKVLGFRGSTLPQITSTPSFRTAAFHRIRLLSYYKNYPQKT